MNQDLGMGGHHRGFKGATNDWLTPPDLLKKLGAFDVDPCCPESMPWRTAPVMYTPAANGLSMNWEGRVWLNPPYGPEAATWLNRLAAHKCGTALIFARTETEMFFDHVWDKARAVLFIKGRLHFYDVAGNRAKANAGAPSVLIAYSDADARTLQHSGIPGKLIHL